MQLFHPMAFMSFFICDHNSYSVVQRKVWFTVFHCIMLIFFLTSCNLVGLGGTWHSLLFECTQVVKMLQNVSQVFICRSQACWKSVNDNALYSTCNVMFDLLWFFFLCEAQSLY